MAEGSVPAPPALPPGSTTAPSAAPLTSSIPAGSIAVAAPTLFVSEGQVLAARVLAAAAGQVELSIAGGRISAESNLPLAAGEALRLVVAEATSQRIVLREAAGPSPGTAQPTALTDAGLPPAAARALLAAAAEVGLTPRTPAEASALGTRAVAAGVGTPAEAAAFARLTAAGLPTTQPSVAGMATLAEGPPLARALALVVALAAQNGPAQNAAAPTASQAQPGPAGTAPPAPSPTVAFQAAPAPSATPAAPAPSPTVAFQAAPAPSATPAPPAPSPTVAFQAAPAPSATPAAPAPAPASAPLPPPASAASPAPPAPTASPPTAGPPPPSTSGARAVAPPPTQHTMPAPAMSLAPSPAASAGAPASAAPAQASPNVPLGELVQTLRTGADAVAQRAVAGEAEAVERAVRDLGSAVDARRAGPPPPGAPSVRALLMAIAAHPAADPALARAATAAADTIGAQVLAAPALPSTAPDPGSGAYFQLPMPDGGTAEVQVLPDGGGGEQEDEDRPRRVAFLLHLSALGTVMVDAAAGPDGVDATVRVAAPDAQRFAAGRASELERNLKQAGSGSARVAVEPLGSEADARPLPPPPTSGLNITA